MLTVAACREILRVDVTEETARLAELHLAEVQTALGIRDEELLHGTGDGDIEQPSLFLYLAGISAAHLVREESFLHAHDEHDGELKSLGGVNGHEAYFVVAVFAVAVGGLAFACPDQRHFVEIVAERYVVIVLFKTAVAEVGQTVEQFLYVLLAAEVLGLLVLIDVGNDAAVLYDETSCLLGIVGRCLVYE